MFEGLNHITLSGEDYPIKCDLVVLENIQDEFGAISEFEERLMPWTPKLDEKGKPIKKGEGKILYIGRIPDIKAVNAALYYMVKEGEEITADNEKRNPRPISRTRLIRKVDLTPVDIADKLHNEFLRCMNVKNEKTTQSQTEIGMKTMEEEDSR